MLIIREETGRRVDAETKIVVEAETVAEMGVGRGGEIEGGVGRGRERPSA